jgi:hypothetical protein
LERQASKHDVISWARILARVRRGAGHATAQRLQDEGEEVARDEDARVESWFEAGVFGAKGGDYSRKAEVEAGSVECGRDCEADDLKQEAVLGAGRVSTVDVYGVLRTWRALDCDLPG